MVGMGLNKAQALRKSGPCHWVSPDGSAVEGTLTIQYGWSTDPMDYPVSALPRHPEPKTLNPKHPFSLRCEP